MELSEVQPSFRHAFFCIAVTIGIVFLGLFVIKADMHAIMLMAILWMMANALYLDNDTNRFKQSLLSAIQKASPVLFIYVLIGTVMGAFIISGAIPTLIYYGLKMITPQFFLPMGLLLCSMTSLALGSCWATIGTMGIACMGLACALHIPSPIAAGMVVSGAYFGDKLSPISDTTLLSANVTNTPLYRHIHAMLYSLIPAYLCCLFIFMMIGLHYVDTSSVNNQSIQEVTNYLQTHYHLGVVTLLPMLVMFVLITLRKPAEMAMLIGIFLALILAIVVQHLDIKIALDALYHPIAHHSTKQKLLDNLLSRGGMAQMLDSLSLTLLILALGGLVEFYHFINVLFTKSVEKIRGPVALVAATLGTSILSNMLVSEAYLSIMLVNKIFSNAYQQHRLHSCLLSKSIEEGTTFSTPLIPWTTSGIFITCTLGISPREYLTWSLLNWLAPLFFIGFVFCRFFGQKIYYSTSHHSLVEAFPQTHIATHLPDDLEKKLDKIITYRKGSLPESNMITTKVLMNVAPQKNYRFFIGKLVPYEKKNKHTPSLQQIIPQQPKLLELVGKWSTDTSSASKEANILGESGSLYVNQDRLQLEVETPTAENLAYYNARLLNEGDSLFMDTQENLPLSVVRVDKNYQHGYLKLPDFGGGYYLEVHDTPHLWSHLSSDGAGVLLLGKKVRKDVYHLSAFELPYGQAIYIPGGVIHSDGLLVGDIMAIYTVTSNYSTVIIKNIDKKICEIEV